MDQPPLLIIFARIAAALALAGCGGGAAAGRTSTAPTHQVVQVVAVTEHDLGAVIAKVLTNPELPNRTGILTGVVRCQLDRAKRLFEAGHEQAAEAALSGAFFIVGGGEYQIEMIQAREEVLLNAATVAAHGGSEARALALYSMLDQILKPGPKRDDVKGHLKALAQWRQTVIDRGGLQSLGAVQRSALPHVLYRPTAESYQAARAATLRWMEAARRFDAERRPAAQTASEQDEHDESRIARQQGVATLVALALRQGDSKGLLETLEDPSVRPSVLPRFAELLQVAIEDKNPEAWAGLLSEFDSLEAESSELGELVRAATFRIALSLFSAEPSSIRAAVPISGLLIAYGMPDAVPIIFSKNLQVNSSSRDPRELGLVLRLTLQALVGLEAIDDVQTARLTFANAKSLIALAEHAPGDVQSSLATLEHVMGAMEVRAGELTLARPHLAEAVRLAPTSEALRLLAAVDLQQRRLEEAKKSLEQIVAMSANEPFALAESQVLRHELLRDLRTPQATAEAHVALAAALQAALRARTKVNSSGDLTSAERVLARVLEHHGDTAGARRAGVRAMEAVRSEPSQLVAVILDTARRALTLSDLQSARAATRWALDEDLDDQDLVYPALWLSLLERQLKAVPDGTALEVLTRTARGKGWSATLSDWALGRSTSDALRKSARSKAERVEADFYLALAARAQGDQQVAIEGLRRVATGEAVELFEVTIARDLLSVYDGWVKPKLPAGIEIP